MEKRHDSHIEDVSLLLGLFVCFLTQEIYSEHYLELFFQPRLSSYSWYEDAVNIAMQLI